MTPTEPAAARGPLTVKTRTIQLGTRTSPAGFSVIDADGEEFAWTWDESRARLISHAPSLLAFVEKIAETEFNPLLVIGEARDLLAAVRGRP